jgi:glutaredoxin 3
VPPKKLVEKGGSSEAVLCRVYIPPSNEVGRQGVMADQKDVVVYVCRPCWRCWLTRRLLGRRGYRFEVIDASNDSRLCSWLAHFTGRGKMPYVFIDHRPVGGLSEIRALERSGALEYLVSGGV